MASPQGFLDINDEVDSPPDDVGDPTVNDILSAVVPKVSGRPEAVRFGSTPVNAGQTMKILDSDPARTRALVGVSAGITGVTLTTLAYVSDRPLDGSTVGDVRFAAAVQLPVIASGSDYLEIQATSELWVTVPSNATGPVYASFITESFSEA